MYTKDQAICIRKVDYSDTSQILTLFCRQSGKISAIAKGSRRGKSSFGSPIGIFSVGEIVFLPPGGGSLATLTEFDHLPLFTHLRDSLFSMNASLMMCELINMLVDEYDPHPGLYDKFVMFLENLGHNISQNQKMALVIVFELGLLTEVGMAIPANKCCNCRGGLEGRGDVFFCAETGGFICRDCEGTFVEKFKVDPQVLTAISKPQTLDHLPQNILWDAERLLIHHLAYLLHKMPKTASYFLTQTIHQ